MQIPIDVIEDLYSRFIINQPKEEFESFDRIFYQIELAHWFYEDFTRTSAQDAQLPHLSLEKFAEQIFQYNSDWARYDCKTLFENYMAYKAQVPVYGGIILNPPMDKCLLVQGYGAKSWGFPKGKVNLSETGLACAIRELLCCKNKIHSSTFWLIIPGVGYARVIPSSSVAISPPPPSAPPVVDILFDHPRGWIRKKVIEEIGFDIGPYIHDPQRDRISRRGNPGEVEPHATLYIAHGVPEDAQFAPQTRKEIGRIQWWPVDSLPHPSQRVSKFFQVAPFVPQWVLRPPEASQVPGEWIRPRGHEEPTHVDPVRHTHQHLNGPLAAHAALPRPVPASSAQQQQRTQVRIHAIPARSCPVAPQIGLPPVAPARHRPDCRWHGGYRPVAITPLRPVVAPTPSLPTCLSAPTALATAAATTTTTARSYPERTAEWISPPTRWTASFCAIPSAPDPMDCINTRLTDCQSCDSHLQPDQMECDAVLKKSLYFSGVAIRASALFEPSRVLLPGRAFSPSSAFFSLATWFAFSPDFLPVRAFVLPPGIFSSLSCAFIFSFFSSCCRAKMPHIFLHHWLFSNFSTSLFFLSSLYLLLLIRAVI
ncbi:putative mRNA-decapping enzyme 2 [Paratrimastix pyriformis]|uniref:mRNA-decapping enzyme 2 n=1 Tax=Paratrimastix pyriformis TaxID=342808 RepID=A0ABQ8U4P0_9EUKA|nr:putative mRNA-decapping enzyme 2 [Paratrimastix pyriformis]